MVNMKAKILIPFFTVTMVFITSFGQAQNKSSDEQVIKMLTDFYSSYITTFSEMPSSANTAKQKALKKKYCTATLLKKIEKDELDYDPFLKAQDSDTEWLKTLVVRKNPKKPNGYLVSYRDPNNNTTISMNVSVIKENDRFKINAVW
jgi:hypothetical protein